MQAGLLLNMYIWAHSYEKRSTAQLAVADCTSSEGRLLSQETGSILELEDESWAVSIAVTWWEVLWLAVVTARTFLPCPTWGCVCVCRCVGSVSQPWLGSLLSHLDCECAVK